MDRQFIKNVGFKYILNNRSLIMQIITMTKENIKLTNTQIEVFIKATSKYLDAIQNADNLIELFGSMDFVYPDQSTFSRPFYKFIHKETYDNKNWSAKGLMLVAALLFACPSWAAHPLITDDTGTQGKGKFQLGTLQYYREIERQESRDEKEGFANLIINSGNRQILTSVISGFDKYILCGTYDSENMEHMSAKYGGYIMIIKNIKSFAEKVKTAIGAQSWYVNEISYSDYKAYSVDTIISDLNGVSPDLSDELFNILYEISEKPSVYSKPTRFKDEKELRLSFTMPRDVKTRLNFDNIGLLTEVEIIKG